MPLHKMSIVSHSRFPCAHLPFVMCYLAMIYLPVLLEVGLDELG